MLEDKKLTQEIEADISSKRNIKLVHELNSSIRDLINISGDDFGEFMSRFFSRYDLDEMSIEQKISLKQCLCFKVFANRLDWTYDIRWKIFLSYFPTDHKDYPLTQEEIEREAEAKIVSEFVSKFLSSVTGPNRKEVISIIFKTIGGLKEDRVKLYQELIKEKKENIGLSENKKLIQEKEKEIKELQKKLSFEEDAYEYIEAKVKNKWGYLKIKINDYKRNGYKIDNAIKKIIEQEKTIDILMIKALRRNGNNEEKLFMAIRSGYFRSY